MTKTVKDLTDAIDKFVVEMDHLMFTPSSYDRGAKIAEAVNSLKLASEKAKVK